ENKLPDQIILPEEDCNIAVSLGMDITNLNIGIGGSYAVDITNAFVGAMEPALGGIICQVVEQLGNLDGTPGLLSELLADLTAAIGDLDLETDPVLADEEATMVAGLTPEQFAD